MKVALELDNKNIIKGYVYLVNQDYTLVLRDNPNLTIAEIDSLEDVVEYKTKYENGQLVQLNDYCQEYYDNQQNEELKIQLQQAIEEINQWFNDYDMQVKQFNRDVRLGEVGTYHIGEEEYTIEELDQEAIIKASQINNLRQQIQEQ